MRTLPYIVSQKCPKALQAMKIIAFGYLPDIIGKILLLKISHTLNTGFGEFKLILARKHCPCRLALIVLKGAIQADGRDKSSAVLPTCQCFKM